MAIKLNTNKLREEYLSWLDKMLAGYKGIDVKPAQVYLDGTCDGWKAAIDAVEKAILDLPKPNRKKISYIR